MVSHLTVTPNSASATSTARSSAASGGGAADEGVNGVFAALLGGAGQTGNAGAKTIVNVLEAALSNLTGPAQADGKDADTKDGKPADPEAVAAVIDAPIAFQSEVDPKVVLTDLLQGLANIKKSLDAGEAVDPEQLKRVDAALETLAARFNIDLTVTPGTTSLAEGDLKALLLSIPADAASPVAQLSTAMAPVTQALLTASSAPAEAAAQPDQLQALGKKLQALLQAITTNAEKSPDLAALTNTAPDGELEAALARLTAATPKVEAVATATPALATPTLKLTEGTLTGKPGDQSETVAKTSEKAEPTKPASTAGLVADSAAKPDTGKDKGSDNSDNSKPAPDARPVDTKVTAAPVAAAPDKTAEPQAVAASQPAQLARADAVAPRVIQAGYQTSQQQLNLPQIAFELVRQVNDGNSRFQMRLDPPELGRIDVKLDMHTSGHINAHLVVDKAETLDLMQRDQRALERALQQAGLDGSKTNLEFSLRQSPFSGGQQQGRDQQGNPFGFQSGKADAAEDVPPTINLYRASLSASGVNILA